MIFNYVLGLKEVNKDEVNVKYREAVRAIIFQNNNILMVHSNKGDYKFPGGGVDKEESHKETLKREVREETGYIINKVKDKIGVIIERKSDEHEKHIVFEMTSYYYICEVSDNQSIQELDDYEEKLEFCPIWIELNKVININEEILKNDSKDNNPWLYRETTVLNALKDYYKITK